MHMKTRAVIATMLAATMLGGCATKGFVRKEVGSLEERQNVRVGEVDKTANDALDRATAAGKLAEGKFVYQMVLSDDLVKFPTDASKLSPEAEAKLTELAQRLISENKNVYLEIQGYTDSTGPEPSNLRLGQARADAALRFLHKQGIAANRMSTISYGEEEPMAPNTTRDGRAANRRIVVVVLS